MRKCIEGRLIIKLGVMILMALFLMGSISNSSEAKTWTKSSLKKELKKTNKSIKKYKKIYKKENRKYKKQTKGLKAISLGATVISQNPFIVSNSELLGGVSYYWIKSGKKNISYVLSTVAAGYLKVTSKTKKYNGITCAVAKAKKVTANPAKYENIVNKLEKKKNDINHALKNSFYMYDKELGVGVGTRTIREMWLKYNEKYTRVKWTSSDPSVATVNSNWEIKALKPGKTVIKAKSSINGKTCTFTVIVKNNVIFKDEKGLISSVSWFSDTWHLWLNNNQADQIWGLYSYNESKATGLKFSCNTTNIVTVSTDGVIKAVGIGSATVIVDSPYMTDRKYIKVDVIDPNATEDE